MSHKHLRRMTQDEVVAAGKFQGVEFSIHGNLAAPHLPALHIKGRIVGADAALLVNKVCCNFDDVGGSMILDLKECTFFSSVAVGFVVELAKQREENGGRLIIAAASRQIRQVIGMLGVGNAFRFCDTLEEGVKSTTESGRWRA